MKCAIISVEYADILSITLPRNLRHFSRIVVATSHADKDTQSLCESLGVTTYVTNDFYRDGHPFRKWLVLEQVLDILGRDGLICVLDADIILPAGFSETEYLRGNLYSPYRRMLDNPKEYTDELDWKTLPLANDREHAGYCHVFHGEDAGPTPWYPDWTSAAGGDSDFQRKWRRRHRVRPNYECLHLGPAGKNWCGRTTDFLHGKNHLSSERQQALEKMLEQRREYGCDPERINIT